ncbi:alpha/beta fold hydrolase, partial [Ruegeria sp. HKCCA5763]|uniref:alpha/beta fold hydrolase n=1 Tax=Ruegeria sp. HKCCA5763 TaxID=2682987 RepID=UPI001488B339
ILRYAINLVCSMGADGGHRFYPESLATVDPRLEQIAIPTKIFWGGEDQILPVDNAHRLAKRLPDSQLQIFEGAGHYCYQDAHEAFAQMVIDWVNQQTDGAPQQ